MATVVVTGATGFIGWHLCEAFRDAGWRVRAIVRPGTRKPLPAGVDVRPAALVPSTPALADAFVGSEVVVHAAGLVRARHDAAFHRVNVGGTEAVVGAMNRAGVRMVLISSQAAIGSGSLAQPSSEDDPPRPLNAYGRSKLAAEDVVRRGARRPWTIIRPPAVYGPRDVAFLPVFKMASRGVFVHVGDPAFPFSLVHVRDLARAIVLAASSDTAAGQTLFIAHRVPVTAESLLRHLASVFGRPYRPRRLPSAIVQAIAAAGDLAWMLGVTPPLDRSRLVEFGSAGFVCSPERAGRVLGFSAEISCEDGLKETVRWYRTQEWI